MAKFRRLRYDPYADYYVVLGVSPFATADEIQAAYRRRAKLLHPDRNRDQRATAQFQLLNEAYDVLSDRHLRDDYNQLRRRAGGGSAAAEPPTSSPKQPYTSAAAYRKAVFGGLLSSPYRYYLFMLAGMAALALAIILFTHLEDNLTAAAPSTQAPQTSEPPLVAQPLDLAGAGGCDPHAQITNPPDGATETGGFDLIGTAEGAYQVEWSAYQFDSTGRPQFHWQPLTSGKAPLEHNVLASRDQTATLSGVGRLRLRLTVTPTDQTPITCEITVKFSTR